MAAAQTFRNGDLVTTGNTSLTFLTVADDTATKGSWEGARTVNFLIEVVAGTPKFGVGGVSANAHACPVGAKLAFSCRNGNLAVQQSAGSDTYRITTVR